MKKLAFRKLEINRRDWGDKETTGSISFSSDHADISLKLTDEHIERIFEIVSARMLEVAQEVSDELLADVIESMPNPDLLDNRKEEL